LLLLLLLLLTPAAADKRTETSLMLGCSFRSIRVLL
jgi:hypothetical protein